jgi:hypothetical protein
LPLPHDRDRIDFSTVAYLKIPTLGGHHERGS